MVPLGKLLWVGDKVIECFQPCDLNGKPQILGFRLGKPKNNLSSEDAIGETGPVPCQHPDWPSGSLSLKKMRKELCDAHLEKYPHDNPRRGDYLADAAKTFTFDLDREEVVTEVHVDYPHYRSIKLVSNLGQEVVFGEEIGDNAYSGVKKADEGEKLLGICAAFGKRDGWTEERKEFSHWGLSQIVVISGKLNDEGRLVE
jgi:hypothetical protein